MSGFVKAYLKCDGCDFETDGIYPYFHAIQELRVSLAERGWVRRGRKDYCPDCVNEGRA